MAMPGWLSRLGIQLLILAKVMISVLWDKAPCQAPCSALHGVGLRFSLPQLIPQALYSHRPITREEIEAVIKKLPRHKSPGPDSFSGEFHEMFEEETIPIFPYQLY